MDEKGICILFGKFKFINKKLKSAETCHVCILDIKSRESTRENRIFKWSKNQAQFPSNLHSSTFNQEALRFRMK